MTFVDLPLPNRPIGLVGRQFALPAAFLFTILIMTALLIGIVVWQGPGLWRDIQISQNPVTLYDADVLDGECTTRRGITDCEARLVYDYEGQSYDTHVSLAFIDFSSDDYTVDVVISGDKPELATVSLGLDMLWNRLAVFAVFSLIFAGGAIGMVIGGLRALGANRAAATPGRLELVPVDVTAFSKGFASYIDHIKGPKSHRTTRTQFPHGQEPLMAVDADGKVVGVAVKAEHISLPILLDRGLTRLDISDAERQLALASFDTQQDGRDAAVVVEKAKPSAAKRALRGVLAFVAVIAIMVIGVFGYWIYYATSASDAFDSIGIEINNLMPEPLNTWACEQLYQRFGDERAPFGCVADDYTSWKVAPATKTKS